MFAKKALLALVATASLAAPVSAFAYDRDRGDGYDRDRYEHRYDQDRRDGDRRFDRDRRDRDDRRYVCRRGVFYMRDSWCARHRGDWNYWR